MALRAGRARAARSPAAWPWPAARPRRGLPRRERRAIPKFRGSVPCGPDAGRSGCRARGSRRDQSSSGSRRRPWSRSCSGGQACPPTRSRRTGWPRGRRCLRFLGQTPGSGSILRRSAPETATLVGLMATSLNSRMRARPGKRRGPDPVRDPRPPAGSAQSLMQSACGECVIVHGARFVECDACHCQLGTGHFPGKDGPSSGAIHPGLFFALRAGRRERSARSPARSERRSLALHAALPCRAARTRARCNATSGSRGNRRQKRRNDHDRRTGGCLIRRTARVRIRPLPPSCAPRREPTIRATWRMPRRKGAPGRFLCAGQCLSSTLQCASAPGVLQGWPWRSAQVRIRILSPLLRQTDDTGEAWQPTS